METPSVPAGDPGRALGLGILTSLAQSLTAQLFTVRETDQHPVRFQKSQSEGQEGASARWPGALSCRAGARTLFWKPPAHAVGPTPGHHARN